MGRTTARTRLSRQPCLRLSTPQGAEAGTQPPGFVRYYDGKGLNQPLCRECVHYADEKFTARGICWEYGAYVSLYSSCRTFERRVGSNAPIVGEEGIRVKYRFGLDDLAR